MSTQRVEAGRGGEPGKEAVGRAAGRLHGLVRAEVRKLITTRGTVALLGAGAVYAIVAGAVTAVMGGHGDLAPLGSTANVGAILRGSGIATWLVFLVAILATAGEAQHRTLTPTLLVTPRRAAVVRAKAITFAGLGMVTALISMVLSMLSAAPILVAKGVRPELSTGHVAGVMIGFTVAAALYGLAGVGLGALVGNQTAATIGGLSWLLLIEGVVSVIVGLRVARWLPGQAANAAISGTGGGVHLSGWLGAAVFAAYAIGLAGLGSGFLLRRDIAG